MRDVSSVQIGRVYEKLTVIKQIDNKKMRTRARWFECKCECGNITSATYSDLKYKKKKSCGCLKGSGIVRYNNTKIKLDPNKYLNTKYERLLITNYVGLLKSGGGITYNCFEYLCDCGKTGKIALGDIGRNKSCGCIWNKFCGEMSGTYFSKIKQHAEKRGIEFNLTPEFVWKLFLNQNRKCALTGVELSFQSKVTIFDGTASLDRIDSSKHYTEDNVQWVHKTVNNIKQSLSEKELFDWANLIVEHNKGRF